MLTTRHVCLMANSEQLLSPNIESPGIRMSKRDDID